MSTPVLFAQVRSVYSGLGADVYDLARDARSYRGRRAVIAHPPCRAWGRLRGRAKVSAAERALALWAVDVVRACGGVLEHPAYSLLWPSAGLPLPGSRDAWGGFTLPILQSWFGHRAPKATWLYVVGLEPSDLPPLPFGLGVPAGRVEMMGRREREATPSALARWLLDVVSVIDARAGEPS